MDLGLKFNLPIQYDLINFNPLIVAVQWNAAKYLIAHMLPWVATIRGLICKKPNFWLRKKCKIFRLSSQEFNGRILKIFLFICYWTCFDSWIIFNNNHGTQKIQFYISLYLEDACLPDIWIINVFTKLYEGKLLQTKPKFINFNRAVISRL